MRLKSFFLTIFFISCFICSIPLLCSHASILQNIDIPSSWNPVGSGARAMGMGGAFIGVADDATAASWNPAGLIQLENPEISIVGNTIYRENTESFGTNSEANNSGSINDTGINYFSASYPFELLNINMIVSLNYQNLYEFNASNSFVLSQQETVLTSTWNLNRDIHIEQTGNLYAMGLAYSLQLHPKLSLGVTLNLWEDWLGKNGWTEKYFESASGTLFINPPGILSNISRSDSSVKNYDFQGMNANFGALWNVSEKFTLGAVFKTGFTADLDFSLSSTSSGSYTENQTLDMPMSYGVGAAIRFSDTLTASVDVYRTHWEDFILTQANGTQVSPITGLSVQESDIDPTTQIRAGLEYLMIKPRYIIPLRAGIFYDPAPATGSPDDYYGFSLGSGFAKGSIVFDITYQFRWGNNVKTSILKDFNYSTDVQEHQVLASFIFHF